MEIPNEFVDVDFTRQPQFVFGDVGSSAFRGMACFEDRFGDQIIPQEQWPALIDKLDADNSGMENLVVEVKNQKNEGSCVGNMATQGMQVLDALEHGKQNAVVLSAISCYKQIGSSPNSGAMVSDALEALTEVGVMPLDTPTNREKFGTAVMPATGFYSQWPADWKLTAKKFRLHESFVIRTVDGLMTSLFKGWPVGVGRQGHSILYVRPAKRNGSIGVVYVNSWGDWGFSAGDFQSGFGFDSMSLVRQSASWAFCFRSLIQRT